MKSMVFEDSVFEECYFEDITSTHTFFRNCTFIASLFYNTGKYDSSCAGALMNIINLLSMAFHKYVADHALYGHIS